jgi:hypothetical protein
MLDKQQKESYQIILNKIKNKIKKKKKKILELQANLDREESTRCGSGSDGGGRSMIKDG